MLKRDVHFPRLKIKIFQTIDRFLHFFVEEERRFSTKFDSNASFDTPSSPPIEIEISFPSRYMTFTTSLLARSPLFLSSLSSPLFTKRVKRVSPPTVTSCFLYVLLLANMPPLLLLGGMLDANGDVNPTIRKSWINREFGTEEIPIFFHIFRRLFCTLDVSRDVLITWILENRHFEQIFLFYLKKKNFYSITRVIFHATPSCTYREKGLISIVARDREWEARSGKGSNES